MMADFFGNIGFAIGFIFFVLVLGAFYLLNRERAHVARLRGPRRFQPDWKRTKAGAPRRRRRARGAFRPDWSRQADSDADPDVEEGGTSAPGSK